MILKTILKTYLYMNCGSYPPDLSTKLCIYFIRTSPGTVQAPYTLEEAHDILPPYFDFGLLNSHPLFMLSQALNKIYTPLLSYRGDDDPIVQRPAIKQAGEEEPAKSVDKVEDEKAARVSFLLKLNQMLLIILLMIFVLNLETC